MKIDQIVIDEGFLDRIKSSYKAGQKDYIARRAAELGITQPQGTSVPRAAPRAAPASTTKTLKDLMVEIDALPKQQQKKLYFYLQEKLF